MCRKVGEIGAIHLHLVSSKSDFMVPSYGQKPVYLSFISMFFCRFGRFLPSNWLGNSTKRCQDMRARCPQKLVHVALLEASKKEKKDARALVGGTTFSDGG